jgi:hypothetical protein
MARVKKKKRQDRLERAAIVESAKMNLLIHFAISAAKDGRLWEAQRNLDTMVEEQRAFSEAVVALGEKRRRKRVVWESFGPRAILPIPFNVGSCWAKKKRKVNGLHH